MADEILREGVVASYDGLPMQELAHVTLNVAVPDPEDEHRRLVMSVRSQNWLL